MSSTTPKTKLSDSAREVLGCIPRRWTDRLKLAEEIKEFTGRNARSISSSLQGLRRRRLILERCRRSAKGYPIGYEIKRLVDMKDVPRETTP
jgi:chromosome segregation and condensation protein ScpB